MVAKAKALGMSALAITDHGNMFGAVKFYDECKSAGVKPIVGVEFYVAGGSPFRAQGHREREQVLASRAPRRERGGL